MNHGDDFRVTNSTALLPQIKQSQQLFTIRRARCDAGPRAFRTPAAIVRE